MSRWTRSTRDGVSWIARPVTLLSCLFLPLYFHSFSSTNTYILSLCEMSSRESDRISSAQQTLDSKSLASIPISHHPNHTNRIYTSSIRHVPITEYTAGQRDTRNMCWAHWEWCKSRGACGVFLFDLSPFYPLTIYLYVGCDPRTEARELCSE